MVLIKKDPNALRFVFHHAAALTWRKTIFPIFPALVPDVDIMERGCFFGGDCLFGISATWLEERPGSWFYQANSHSSFEPQFRKFLSVIHQFHIRVSNLTLTPLHYNLPICLLSYTLGYL